MPRPKEIPLYALHKPTGCARVRINGQDHYLGRHGTPESRAAYAKFIAETFWPGAAPAPVKTPDGTYPDISVNGMLWGDNSTSVQHAKFGNPRPKPAP